MDTEATTGWLITIPGDDEPVVFVGDSSQRTLYIKDLAKWNRVKVDDIEFEHVTVARPAVLR